MKNMFVEKDGLLFIKCKPELLKVDTPLPCLVRFVMDDSPMGIFNDYNSMPKGEFVCSYIGHSGLVEYENTVPELYFYSRYEIVGKLCPEGSREWALYQILKGKEVYCNNKNYKMINGHIYYLRMYYEEDICYYCNSHQEWLNNMPETGWEIYEEPKPTLEVGKWYFYKIDNCYLQCMSTNEEGSHFRLAGQADARYDICPEMYHHLTSVSLEPNFSDVKLSDNAFSTIHGWENIVVTGVKGDGRVEINECYEVDGRLAPLDEHPVLFHTSAQCAAYFAEVALRESEGYIDMKEIK